MSSPPIDSRDEEVVGGIVEEGDLAREEHSITTIEDGIIRKDVRRVTRFLHCGHSTAIEIGGRCSICDAIVCSNCFRLCQRCRRSLCNNHQRLKNGASYCDGCFWIVTFFGDRSGHRESRANIPQQNQNNNTQRNRSAEWFRFFFGE